MKSKAKNRILLSIGGLDPSGCAGILADVRVWNFFSLPSRAVLTAVTAQSETRFYGWKAVDLKLFRKQLKAAASGVWGVKLGMLATPGHLDALLHDLKRNPPRVLLWDPVLRSSTGATLLNMRRPDKSFRGLLAIADVFTPNLPEAEWLLGQTIKNIEEMTNAARAIALLMKKNATLVLKGGHLSRKAGGAKAVDVVAVGGRLHHLQGSRIRGDRRGTGCTFGAALLAHLALGKAPVPAARASKRYVVDTLFA